MLSTIWATFLICFCSVLNLQDPSKLFKKGGEAAAVEHPTVEGRVKESSPLLKKLSPLCSEVPDYGKPTVSALLTSRDPDLKDRDQVNGTATVTERLAHLIASCPSLKSSKTKQKKPAVGTGSGFAKDSGRKLLAAGSMTVAASKDFTKKLPGNCSLGAPLCHKDFAKKPPGASGGVGLTSKDSGGKKQPGPCPSVAALVSKDCGKKLPVLGSPVGLVGRESGKKPLATGMPIGLISKDPGKRLLGTSSAMGLINKDPGKKLLGTVSPPGLIHKDSGKKHPGSGSPMALVNRDAGKKHPGSDGPVGGLSHKDSVKKLPGPGSPSGLVHKDSGKKPTGASGPMGLMSKEPGKKLLGVGVPTSLAAKEAGTTGINCPSGLASKDLGVLKADTGNTSSEPFQRCCGTTHESLATPEPAGLLKDSAGSKTFEKHVLKRNKESVPEKPVQKENAGGSCIQQDSSSPSERSEMSRHEKQLPVYCTSPDFRMSGGASDLSAAKSPFSAAGEGNLPSPSPAAAVATLTRSPTATSAHLAPTQLPLNSTPEVLEGISNQITKTPLASNGTHMSMNRLSTSKGVRRELNSSKAVHMGTSKPCPTIGKKPSLAAESNIRAAIAPSVVSFSSLFNNKPFLKVGAITASGKPCQGAESVSSGSGPQAKPLKKRKGRKPRRTKVVSRSACQPPKGLELGRPELFKNITCSALSNSNLDQAKLFKNSLSPSFAEHEFVKCQLPKLSKSSSMPSLPLLNSVDSGGCVPGELLPEMYRSKRGRFKPQEMPHLEGPPKRTLKIPASKVFSVQSKEEQEPPVLHPEVEIPSLRHSLTESAFPKKRGRPKRLIRSGVKMKPPVLSVAPFVTTEHSDKLESESEQQPSADFFEVTDHLGGPEELAKANVGNVTDLEVEPDRKETKRSNGQLMKTIIRKINKMKTIKRKKLLNQILSSTTAEPNKGKVQSKLHTTVSTFAATFGSKLGQQINVSKKGTIYIGKRRGRKPKAVLSSILSGSSASLTVLEKSAQQVTGMALGQAVPTVLSSVSHNPDSILAPVCSPSSGVSGGQSPVSRDIGFVEPNSVPYLHLHSRQGSMVQTLAMRKASKARRRLSPPTLLPNSPSHMNELSSLKEATPSPISESHSDETIPSDSGIGTDNNSTSDRAEKFCGGPKKRRHSFDHISLVPPETSTVLSSLKEKHKHKCKRRGHDFLAYDKMKRQKRKRKKKYPQLRGRQDPDFLAELEELISRLSEIRITHRSHHFIPRDLLPTIFRINFNSFYTHPTFPLDPLHYIRKPDLKKKRGRPPKMREAMAEMPFMHSLSFPLSGTGFYPSYGMPYSPSPLAAAPIGLGYYGRYPPALYPPPPSPSFTTPLPPPSYMHTGHLLLNPAKYHKKKHKLLRQEAFLTASRAPLLSMSTYHPSVPPEMAYGWMLEHKHRHRHKHREHRSSEPPQVSMDTLAANSSSRTVLESLKRYRFGKEAVSERYKHKEKHRCHMACPHLSPSKGLLGREEQWARREPAESGSLALGLQPPLQIDCSDTASSLPLGRFTPSSEPASSDEHTNLFTSAIGSCRVTNSASGGGRKKLSDSPQDVSFCRPLGKEPLSPMEKALPTLAGKPRSLHTLLKAILSM